MVWTAGRVNHLLYWHRVHRYCGRCGYGTEETTDERAEEVGIAVKDIRYFGSQPWPFPDSLMIGFTAVYAGGEITVDKVELTHTDWFNRDNLPEIPPSISIARLLIDAFVYKNRAPFNERS